jgi:hypothetical protein
MELGARWRKCQDSLEVELVAQNLSGGLVHKTQEASYQGCSEHRT